MRLIDADELESLFDEQIKRESDIMDAFDDALQDTPTVDAVPVVRCRDCKHLWRDLTGPFCGYGWGLRRIYHDTFCSYGEREHDAHA